MDGIAEDVRQELLVLAREAVRRALTGAEPPLVPASLSEMTEPRAAFVTIRSLEGELRGCRGEIPPRRPLPECVCHVAVASALDDPRFPPVREEDLPALRFEISALTEPTRIRPEEVEIGRHGLLITTEWTAGLLLPQVPVSQRWYREGYLAALCVKAGLETEAWRQDGVILQAFEAEVWGESER